MGGYPKACGKALEPPPEIGWGDGSARVFLRVFHGLLGSRPSRI